MNLFLEKGKKCHISDLLKLLLYENMILICNNARNILPI